MAVTVEHHMLLFFILFWGICDILALDSTIVYHYPEKSLRCKPHGFGKQWDCSHRDLQNIPPDILNLHNMTALYINNNRLKNITGSSFLNLVSLLWLDLTFNEISAIMPDAFPGLFNLEQLYLSNNKITSLPEDVFLNLERLWYLDLSFNWLDSIPSQAVAPLKSLQMLSLLANNLTDFTIGNGFQQLKHLSSLILGEKSPNGGPLTKFNVTSTTFEYLNTDDGATKLSLELVWYPETFYSLGKLTNVNELSLIRCPEDDFQSVEAKLQTLSISHFEIHDTALPLHFLKKWRESLTSFSLLMSHISSIEGSVFVWAPLLRKLDLSYHTVLQHLSNDTFSGLNYLEELILSNNGFKQVPSNALQVFTKPATLRVLDLSYNSIKGSIPADAFATVPFLTDLNLAGNYRIDFREDWTAVLVNLKVLHLENTYINMYNANPIPSLTAIYVGVPQVSEIELLIKRPLCNIAHHLIQASLPNYSLTQPLAAVIGNECLYLQELDIAGCFKHSRDYRLGDPKQVTINLLSLFKLNTAHNKLQTLTEIAFIKMPALLDLDLSYNEIQTIDESVLPMLANVRYLKLQGNNLVSLNGLQNLNFLELLSAAQNQITTVPKTSLDRKKKSDLIVLDLSNNPFDCTCDIVEFKNWITKDTVTWLVSENQYICASPGDKKGMSITQVDLDCKSDTVLYLGIGAACVLVLGICVIAIMYYRWHIKYKLFLVFQCRYRRYTSYINDAEGHVSGHHYDAYVAYDDNCIKDECWVINDLRLHLEEGPQPFHLCIKGRDFIPGDSIVDTISESIQQSRRTILILSQSFVESEWCYFEMQMARMRLFNENRDVLILVMLEDIPDNKLTLSLRQLLCKLDYFKWTNDRAVQDLFWCRLREEIKKPVRVDRRHDL